MNRLSRRVEGDVEITVFDLTGLSAGPEAVAIVRELQDAVGAPEEKSLLTLTDVTGSDFNDQVARAIFDLVKFNKPFVRAAAIVGLQDDRQRGLLDIVSSQGRRRFATFDTEDEAVSWLVEQVGEPEG